VSPRLRSLAFAAGLGAVVLISIEIALQSLSIASASVRRILASPWDLAVSAPTIPDLRLEFRPNPALRGHDSNGFRNPRVPEQAQIVVFGDSQTYGTGVAADETWPRVLERELHRTTYSMAAGGYGPVHSLILLDEARRLRPAVAIEALYAGNDLYDAYRFVYQHGQFPELRSPGAGEAIRAADGTERLEQHVVRLGRECLPQLAPSRGEPGTRLAGLLRWIAERSKTYGLARRVRYELTPLPESEPAAAGEGERALPEGSPSCPQFAAGGARTVLMPDYRLAALDTGDPRIREGERIAFRALRELQGTAAREGVRLIVLGIPTKELVFDALGAAALTPRLAALIAREKGFWAEVRRRLADERIEFVETLGPLQDQLRAGPQPYRESADGHPSPVGHRVIAKALAAYLSEPPR